MKSMAVPGKGLAVVARRLPDTWLFHPTILTQRTMAGIDIQHFDVNGKMASVRKDNDQ